ncbi:ATP-binding protein [Hyalangium rubrum]|uniref:histidine kinase n=1 Tax=Hyalangium rubrum TaxID=3103134 RepID=A0ABU5HIN4_9BACT|nr:ATP-binding protein [Hyalangium sp. s54d21]MDY7233017.1 ATP-binding protein [Hyalangium sp. s54d21]
MAPRKKPKAPKRSLKPEASVRNQLAAMADPLGLLEGLFTHSPVPYAVFSAEGQCLLINPAYREMFGAEPPPEYNLFQDEVTRRQGVDALFRRAFQGETLQTPIFWYDPKELKHIQVPEAKRAAISCSLFPLKGPGNEVRHVAIAYKDVTAELTIRDAEEARLQRVLKAGGLGHWQLELATGKLQCSEGFKATFELPPEADLSSLPKLCPLIHPEDQPAMSEAMERAISQGVDYAAEYRVRTPEGALRWVVARGSPVRGADGTVVAMTGITLDVTELRKAEGERARLVRELAEERARLQEVLDNLPAGVILAEAPNGRITFANAQVERILRKPPPAAENLESYQKWVGFRGDGQRVEAHEWPLARTLQGETVDGDDILLRRGDGVMAWVRVGGAPIRHEGRITGGVVAFYDIQQEKRAQARLRALADTSTVLAQATTDFNAALEQLARLGGETLGECCVLTLLDEESGTLDVVAAYHPDPAARKLIKTAMYGPFQHAEGPAVKVVKTGRPILQVRIPQEGLLESMPPPTREFVERFGLHSSLLVPLRAQGRIIGTLGVSRGQPGHPYTLEDQDFLQEMADRAGLTIQNMRLLKTAQEAVRLRDDFLSVASHELKTPLTPLSLKLQSLERMTAGEQAVDATEQLARDVEMMRRQVKRLSDLINDLLDVARISGGRLKLVLEEVDLLGLVLEVVSRFELEAERTGGRLEVHAEEPILGNWDRLRLEQVVTNLLSNALKYGAGKPIHVRVEAVDGHARLTVRDEGIGVEAKLVGRIFEKFERAVSDRHYGGLGLGLYITRQIVEALGGTIAVESAPHQGATFTVSLPLLPS